ncbi:hypothetical protein HY989_01485 [Candidatus Micrarchaeota archaeon]|nr:hypothetical protein [Candidatus Micrarchaeota archaeon]
MNMWGEIPNLADFEHFMLTNKIMAFLGLQVKKTKSEISAGEAFGILVTSTERSYLQQEELGLFTILAQIQSSKEAKKLFENDLQIIIQNIAKLPKIHSLLKKHTEKYDWMQFHYDGPIILQMDYFIDILRSEIKQGIDGSQKIKSILGNESALVKRQMELEKKLSLSENQKYWLKVARTFSYLKGIRKDTVFMGSRNSGPLINEIARRLGLSPKQVRHSTPLEISDALVNGKIDVNLINQRIALCVIIWDKNKIRITVGKEAKGLVARVYEDKADPNQKELIGMPAYPGLVSGIVKIVNKSSDMEKVQKGDILVSSATNPNLVPAMKKAGAIVTDEGGVTCHAAIVSRELKIPCVIGTKVATKLLRDGDKVEVDAINGIVRKLGS